MRVLLVDNNIFPEFWGASDLRSALLFDSGVEVTVVRGPHSDLPESPRGFDRIVLSGSKTSAMEDASWITELETFLRMAMDQSIPLLGVCYGHQMIARALQGKKQVGLSQQPEFGWTEIRRVGSSRILEGLDKKFYSFSAHFDEVLRIPSKDFIVTASSADCAIQAMEHRTKPIFGIQFHPERDAEAGDQSLVSRKKQGTPAKLLHYGKGKQFYKREVGRTIFQNFLLLNQQ